MPTTGSVDGDINTPTNNDTSNPIMFLCDQGTSYKLPEIYMKKSLENYSADHGNYFDVTKPIFTLTADNSVAIPVGSDKYICFKLSTAGLVTANIIYSINASIHPLQADLTVQAATAVIATYGFNIIGIWYINSNEFLMMYNWQSSATARSITYSRLFGYTSGKLYMSNADSTFAASLLSTSGSVAGSSYSGYIFKSDFNGNGNKLGIAYLRKAYTAANVNNQSTLWYGYMAAYVTTNATYKSIAKALVSLQQVNVSVSGYQLDIYPTASNLFYSYAYTTAGTTRTYIIKDNATNVGGTAAMIYSDAIDWNSVLGGRRDRCDFLGRLSDGNYVFHNRWDAKWVICSVLYASANSTIQVKKIGEINVPSEVTEYHSKLLKNDILMVERTPVQLAHLYQVIYDNNDQTYKLNNLGKTKLNLINTNNPTKKYYASDILDLPRPNGLYSDIFRSIGTNVNINIPDVNTLALSLARNNLAATTVGNYAIFGGGYSSSYTAVVDAYDASLTHTIPTALSVGRRMLAATTVGNYALFGGGSYPNTAVVDAYDTSLTRTTPIALSIARCELAATTVGNYALFGGGSSSSYTAVIDVYDTSLTRTTPIALSIGRCELAATTVGNYAIFGGGYSSSYTAVVDAYDASLTHTIPTALSAGRSHLAATTVGNCALFGGGMPSDTTVSKATDAYNNSLTRTTPTALSLARTGLAATTVGNYAIFGGGDKGTTTAVESNVVNAYNSLLTLSTSIALLEARYNLAATTVGNYALFCGGYGFVNYGYFNTIDAYVF